MWIVLGHSKETHAIAELGAEVYRKGSEKFLLGLEAQESGWYLTLNSFIEVSLTTNTLLLHAATIKV